MTRKGTLPAGAAALLLSLALLAPPTVQAQPSSPGEVVGAMIGRLLARWKALQLRERNSMQKECEHGPSIDPNGCPLATTTYEALPMIEPEGNNTSSEQGPSTDPNG